MVLGESLRVIAHRRDLCLRGGESWPRGSGFSTGLMKSLRPREFKGVVSVAESSPVSAGALGRSRSGVQRGRLCGPAAVSMTGIGIVLLVSLTTGSFGQAGLLIGAMTVAGAAVAPLWGRATDRVGQARLARDGLDQRPQRGASRHRDELPGGRWR